MDVVKFAAYAAPAALVDHCKRAATTRAATDRIGTRDRGDVAALLQWLNERSAFEDYSEWLNAGMALRLEYGDDGFELWEITFDETVTADVAETKWNSFSTEPTPGCTTLNTLLSNAHKLGWRGTIRKSAAAMFDGVAQIAAAAGASLSSAQSGMPMMAGQQLLTELSEPIIDEFLSATSDAPLRPAADDFPTLPPSLVGHGLYNSMCDAIARIFAMAEAQGNKFKSSRCNDVLAVLNCLHVDVFDAVCRRLRANGHPLQDRKIKWAAANIAEKIERVTVTQDKWEYDRNGLPESDNSDNVVVFLGIIGVEVRWNAWLERMEIRGGTDPDLHWREWTYIDDAIVAKLRTRANRTKTRFRPGKEFFWESLLAIAHSNTIDPALDLLAELESNWDGTPRLSIWMSHVCGVPCDPYHQAVGRNIIGGMVRRLRHPGCKHDTMAVFFGFQGSGKSTLASIISMNEDWFTDTVLLGAEAKELVLALAGKSVAEIGEMGMRGSANASHVKAMLSRQVDEGRTAYARAVTARPRRNIFIGTTNEDEPLQDPTGNRRFLPVRVDQEIDLEWLRANIKQLIGEAARLETKGADFAIPRDVWGIAAEHQERARASGDMEISLHEWFGETPFTGAVNYITAHDMVKLCGLAGWRNGSHNSMRGALMKRMGFRSEKPMMNGKRTTVWVRGHCTPADIPRVGVRYVVGVDKDGQAIVSIRREAPVPTT